MKRALKADRVRHLKAAVEGTATKFAAGLHAELRTEVTVEKLTRQLQSGLSGKYNPSLGLCVLVERYRHLPPGTIYRQVATFEQKEKVELERKYGPLPDTFSAPSAPRPAPAEPDVRALEDDGQSVAQPAARGGLDRVLRDRAMKSGAAADLIFAQRGVEPTSDERRHLEFQIRHARRPNMPISAALKQDLSSALDVPATVLEPTERKPRRRAASRARMETPAEPAAAPPIVAVSGTIQVRDVSVRVTTNRHGQSMVLIDGQWHEIGTPINPETALQRLTE
ncbi:MAG: hypothetical protein Greene041619_978 [Candidatus Peregrinibacteria bacterium Greene0416_19]|nr:MAG: hypothetical protein Greene041619_978 [Candidatus Peregrinibacteria bacterium Greene0416_19]